jgi:hypothetical protein
MSGNVRMLPARGPQSAWAGSPSNAAGRRYYNASPGQVIDVVENDANAIASSGFFSVAFSGPTSGRPTNANLTPGYLYLDTDIALIVAWDGVNWRNPVTGAVA